MTPDVTLFLRTYRGDALWVVELMRSLDRWVKIGPPDGFRELVVHVDPQDVEIFRPIIGARGRIVSSPARHQTGWRWQQAIKLSCDLWAKGPYVQFIDSDYFANQECKPEMFFREGRPDLLITSYESLQGTVPYQATVEKILGFPCPYETMRGPYLTFPTELFPALRNHIIQKHGVTDVLPWLCQFQNLSEFNLAGSFALKVAYDRFHWRDTGKMPLPNCAWMQFWSGAGITSEVRAKMDAALS